MLKRCERSKSVCLTGKFQDVSEDQFTRVLHRLKQKSSDLSADNSVSVLPANAFIRVTVD